MENGAGDERIGEAHVDVSSGAYETYCAANASMDLLFQSYIAEEAGVPFPKVMKLQLDNSTAESFSNNSAKNTALKHIDCRQWWVRMLRDRSVMIPKHCDTKRNVADLFTKILPKQDFQILRDMVMSILR